MSNSQEYVLLIVLGLLLITIPIVKASLDKLGVPALVGFIGLGLLSRLVDNYFPFITSELDQTVTFLAQIGIVILLFQVGLKSNIKGLIKKLPYASIIWISNVLVSFLLGYLAARYLIHLPILPSLVVATAMTATSVAVSIVIWQEKGKTNTSRGQLLIDVAELDDLSSILLLAVLLAIIPVIQGGESVFLGTLGTTIGTMIIKLTLFITACYWFAHSLEPGFTKFNLEFTQSKIGLTIGMLGMGLTISAIAGYFGFSLAIGAFMAGLAFSRDHQAVLSKTRIQMFYAFFVPFFFIHIGMEVSPDSVVGSLGLAIPLIFVAIAGKMIGVGLPVLIRSNRRDALLLGVSMIPRAEIAMLIIIQASILDKTLIPPQLYSAMVLVVVLTSIISPVVLKKLNTN